MECPAGRLSTRMHRGEAARVSTGRALMLPPQEGSVAGTPSQTAAPSPCVRGSHLMVNWLGDTNVSSTAMDKQQFRLRGAGIVLLFATYACLWHFFRVSGSLEILS